MLSAVLTGSLTVLLKAAQLRMLRASDETRTLIASSRFLDIHNRYGPDRPVLNG